MSADEARARKLGFGWKPPFSPPTVTASHNIILGKLSPLAASENSPVGKAIREIVARAEHSAGNDWAGRVPLSFAEYCEVVRNIDKLGGALHRDRYRNEDAPPVYIPNDSAMLRRLVKSLFDRERHTPDFTGYVRYVQDVNDKLDNAVTQVLNQSTTHLHENDRHEHTLIVGGTGSGKSELLKLLVHHSVKHPELGAVLVLDPHAKLAPEIARWREFAGKGAERLVYLDATARDEMDGLTPALNPLVCGSASSDERFSLALQLADALAYLAGEGEGQTSYMRRVATFGIRVLLDKPNSTLLDLLNSLARKDGAPIAALGKKHPDELVRQHYENQFFGESYKSAKSGLGARLEGALLLPIFRRMMLAPDPLDFQGAIEAGKIIAVNCASAGEAATVALGRFLIAQVAALGNRRAQNPTLKKAPLHVIVDEATKFMSPPVFQILKEMRKQNIWITMVQQDLGDGVPREMRSVLKTNTTLKMFGLNDTMGDV